nr:anti-sigma factor [Acidobacteriota bacterium]
QQTAIQAQQAELASQERSLAVLRAPDLIQFTLRGEPAQPALARAFWSHRHGMIFTAEGLGALPSGRTYQLWVISKGTPISAGTFEIAGGQARVVVATPASLTQVDAIAVTIEPAGGLSAPSTTPILVGTGA